MRPASLNPLFASLRDLNGVGARLEEALGRLTGAAPDQPARVINLLWHFPSGIIDRRDRPAIADIVPGNLVTLNVVVKAHRAPPPSVSRAPYKVICEDDTGRIELVFFHADRRYLQRVLPVGERRIVSGRAQDYGKHLQITHPDHIAAEDDSEAIPLLEPVYPLGQGVSQRALRSAIRQAVARVPDLPEWLDRDVVAAREWPGFRRALEILHTPGDDTDLAAAHEARKRLACDELLASQLALALMRRRFRRLRGRSVTGTGERSDRIRAALSFTLTGAQERTLAEILADMAAPHRMLRLLQGDVGSGKTLVALLAMAAAVEAGGQAALMAPTEVLARQHYKTIAELGAPAGLRVALLTGRETGAARNTLLKAIKDGHADIIVGTHALFQADVEFRDLALAVIDEQHRFGVYQRLALQAKGNGGVDILVATATPIPRTLMMTHYGDMDVSVLDEKPPGRKPVTTRAVPTERIHEVIDAIRRTLASGSQVFWVCPLVESSDLAPATAAEERAAHLRQHFGDRVGLVHGRMKGAERDAVMSAFAAGDIGILVSTTVVEVGVDVPNASVMVIEHAERFGLAQLHQLRGRVGRGSAQATCLLLYQGPLSETAEARLKALRDTDDGFRIAEADLRLRGGGEILGARQSGDPGFRVARLPEDSEVLELARDQAKLLLERDPELSGRQGAAARACLYLFERDAAIKAVRAG
ncbi:MAG: ATP-dependent DNA helicase RecG [Dichotomicrobium sp.]